MIRVKLYYPDRLVQYLEKKNVDGSPKRMNMAKLSTLTFGNNLYSWFNTLRYSYVVEYNDWLQQAKNCFFFSICSYINELGIKCDLAIKTSTLYQP